MTFRNYQPVAWVLYQRVIDQSKADIFIKPGIIVFVSGSSTCLTVIFTTQQHKVIQNAYFLVSFLDRRIAIFIHVSLSLSHYTICNVLYQYNTQNQCIFTTQITSFLFYTMICKRINITKIKQDG